jgi:transposase
VASDKKRALRLGAHIVFVDESGFLLMGTVRKTWAPRGQTPKVAFRYKHDKVSVISGLSVTAYQQRVGLYYSFHHKNIQQPEVCDFLRHLLRHFPDFVIVILDNAKIHRGQPIRELCERHGRLRLEYLPGYAPELNPDEGVWDQAKNALANGRPDTIEVLGEHLSVEFEKLRKSPASLRACIHNSDLPVFLR